MTRPALIFGPLLVGLGLLFFPGCDTHCLETRDILWEPAPDEYRLVLTNRSPSIVEIRVDGESQGVFCDGVEDLPVGNFPRDTCSEIRAIFLDNPDRISLDDCHEAAGEGCRENNIDGRVCYDTTYTQVVEATLD